MAEPTRTCVAPIAIALSKSLLIPIDNPVRPFLRAIFLSNPKCSDGLIMYWGDDHQAFTIGKPSEKQSEIN